MLLDLIRAHIVTHGYINVADYMQLCLLHPEHGYYTSQPVFGAQGDFITAPEISQLFGEIIGIWAVLEWQNLGSPSRFHLMECGPGRGTLMRDLLRGANHIPGFNQAARVQMIEASPVLQEKQKQALSGCGVDVAWCDIIPDHLDHPVLIIANEFLDALPIRQAIAKDKTWHERVIIVDDREKLAWGTVPLHDPEITKFPDTADLNDGTIFEFSNAVADAFGQLCGLLKACKGAAVIIDYGDYVTPRLGETLQAMKEHHFIDVLEAWHHADITAHIDFHTLERMAQQQGLKTSFLSQAEFLKFYGIDIRLKSLLPKASPTIIENLLSGYHRLVDADKMGQLFKVLLVQA